MFKVILLVLGITFFMYGMADMLGIIKHVSTYSDAMALLLCALCLMVRSLLVKDEAKPMAKRN